MGVLAAALALLLLVLVLRTPLRPSEAPAAGLGALAVAPAAPSAPATTAATAAPAALTRGLALPRTMSVAQWLAGHSADWRVARLQENPAVLVLEFPGLAEQGAAMNRIAALLEKAEAPRDRVLGDAELAALIARAGDNAGTFYQGHDYDGAGLARFFTLARQQGQALNPQETRLYQLLLTHGLLVAGADATALQAPGAQAMITFTATQADDPATPQDETVDLQRRESVLRHELSHGRFFTRPGYRRHCERFWHEMLTASQRDAFRRYLAGLGYDPRNEELMLNEAQALLMHTPDTRAFSAALVGLDEPGAEALRARFWHSLPADADPPEAPTAPATPARPRQ